MTETIEYLTVDRTGWGPGPWDGEPDKMQWEDAATAMPCLVVRQPRGHLCGYVGVTADHPDHGKGYDDIQYSHEDADIDGPHEAGHGELTFAGPCSENGDESSSICHIPGPGDPDNVWWFGFDCAHHMDLSPGSNHEPYERGCYRTHEYVQGRCAMLAQSLAERANT